MYSVGNMGNNFVFTLVADEPRLYIPSVQNVYKCGDDLCCIPETNTVCIISNTEFKKKKD